MRSESIKQEGCARVVCGNGSANDDKDGQTGRDIGDPLIGTGTMI